MADAYTRPEIVSGETRLNKELFDTMLDGIDQASVPGQEIAGAARRSQYSWSGDGVWQEVEGLNLHVATPDGPAYMETNLGLCVVNGSADVVVEYRILDSTLAVQVAYNTINLPGRVDGFNSLNLPPIKGRLRPGLALHRFCVQVKVTGAFGSAYIVPDWLPGASGELYVIGA